jgi:uncharacterized membrane protein YidH (DUF202 family)
MELLSEEFVIIELGVGISSMSLFFDKIFHVEFSTAPFQRRTSMVFVCYIGLLTIILSDFLQVQDLCAWAALVLLEYQRIVARFPAR